MIYTKSQIDTAVMEIMSNNLPIKIDMTYQKGCNPESLEFQRDDDGKWCLPIKRNFIGDTATLRQIAILGWDCHSEGGVLANYICFRVFPILDKEEMSCPLTVGVLVTDRSSLWLYKPSEIEQAKEVFVDQLRTLNNPFGDRSYSEVNMRVLRYQS